jgi:two-component system sensor histidine kinase AlgZ
VIEPASEGGTIRIEGRVAGEGEGAAIALDIVNTVDPDAPAPSDGNHMALENVRERIEAFFGPGGSLETSRAPGEFRVRLRFPVAGDEDGR